MERIGIIVAMGSEFERVAALLEDKKEKVSGGFSFTEGDLGGRKIILAKSGIGKVCAAVGVAEMIRGYAPDCIINTGVAGGIDDTLRVMDVVVGERTVYHDVWCGEGNEYGQIQGMPAVFHADSRLLQVAKALQTDVHLMQGLVCTGDQFITDRKALDKIKEKFPEGLAVDMESCAMAQVCHMYSIPFLSFRVISDTPGNTDDHASQYKDFWATAAEKSFGVLKQLVVNL